MKTPRLETDRLLLREIHSEDVDAIFNCWMQDEDVSRYMWWKTTYAVENYASGCVLQKLGFQFVKEIPYECNGGEIVTTGNYCRYEAFGRQS